MRLVDLLGLYLFAGCGCAVAIRLRVPGAGWLSVLTCVPLWPLWAPVALATRAARAEGNECAADVESALAELVAADSYGLIDEQLVERIRTRASSLTRSLRELEAARGGERNAALDSLIAARERELTELRTTIEALRASLLVERSARIDGDDTVLEELRARLEALRAAG